MAEPNPQTGQGTGVQTADAISIEELTTRIEQARSEERQKLHADREKDRKRLKELDDKNKGLEGRIAELEAKPQTRDTETRLQTLEVQLQETKAQYEQRLRDADERAEKAEKESKKRVQDLELRLYKERKIADLHSRGIGVIESLIVGNTAAEIDKAIEFATAEYENIKKKVEASIELGRRATPLPGGPASGPSNKGTDRAASTDGEPAELTAEDIGSMSPEEYLKHRSKLLGDQGVDPVEGFS